MKKVPISEDKDVTVRICENVIYLAEKKGIKHISSVEGAIGLSRGYISRCMGNDSKRLAIDTVCRIARFFNVGLEEITFNDLRGYDDNNVYNENLLLLEGEEEP